MLIVALAIGSRIHQFDTEKGFTPIIDASSKNDIIGVEGALATACYVYGNWLKALDYISIKYGSDDGDLSLNGRLIDVKNGRDCRYGSLLIPRKQWCKRRYDFYVKCGNLGEEWVRIWGYASKAQLEEKGFWKDYGYGDTFTLLLKDLSDINGLNDKTLAKDA